MVTIEKISDSSIMYTILFCFSVDSIIYDLVYKLYWSFF